MLPQNFPRSRVPPPAILFSPPRAELLAFAASSAAEICCVIAAEFIRITSSSAWIAPAAGIARRSCRAADAEHVAQIISGRCDLQPQIMRLPRQLHYALSGHFDIPCEPAHASAVRT